MGREEFSTFSGGKKKRSRWWLSREKEKKEKVAVRTAGAY